MNTSKICTKCNTSKKLSEFRYIKTTQKYRSNCIECEKEYAKNYKANNDLKIKQSAKKTREKIRKTKIGLIKRIYDSQRTSSKKRKHNLPTYSQQWLIDFIMSNKNFNTMYNNWVESNYDRNLIPSIDRIDDYKGYTEDNIRLVVFKDNRNRYYSDAKNGINNKQNKSIIQLTKDGKKVNIFHSISEAYRITGIDRGDISKVALNKKKSAGGFIWRYK
jgi:hypothetical protein